MQLITALSLKNKMDSKENFKLIDVREPDEHAAFNTGGTAAWQKQFKV